MARATYYYSTRSGETSFAGKPGTILKFKKPRPITNRKLGYRTDHEVYVWILRHYRAPKNQQAKFRQVAVVWFYIPVMTDGWRYFFVRKSKIKHTSLMRIMLEGYQVVDTKAEFNYTKWSVRNAYRRMGLLPDEKSPNTSKP